MSIPRADLDAARVDLSEVIDQRRSPMKPIHPGNLQARYGLKVMRRAPGRRHRPPGHAAGGLSRANA